MVNLQPDASHNIEMMLHHQVVNHIHGAGVAVLKRNHAVAAKAFFNGLKYRLKTRAEEDFGIAEELLAGSL